MPKAKVLHPPNHIWAMHGDVITKRDRKRPVEIRREERCDYCPRERYWLIDVVRWVPASGKMYRGQNVPMDERVSSETALEQEIRATTDLEELKAK